MEMKKLYSICYLLLFSQIVLSQVVTKKYQVGNETIEIDELNDIGSVTPNETQSGRTVITNQATYFGWFLHPVKTVRIQARVSLWKGHELLQLGDIHELEVKQGAMNGRRIPCYVKVPAGRYIVKPLLRELDKEYWTIPEDYSYYDDDDDMLTFKNWEYDIEDLDTYKAPSILLLRSENLSEVSVNGNIPSLFNQPEQHKCNERFDVYIRFSNNSNKAKRGKVKLVWERNFEKFWRGYSPAPVATQWSDCISKGATMNGYTDWDGTGLPIEIPANTKEVAYDVKGCYATTFHDFGNMYTPFVHVYFQPEGESDWVLCGINSEGDYDSDHNLIPLQYQKNSNSFVLWIEEGNPPSVAPSPIPLIYDKHTKKITIDNMPEKTYVFLYKMDGYSVVAESSYLNKACILDVSLLPVGAYILKIINNTDIKSFKIII